MPTHREKSKDRVRHVLEVGRQMEQARVAVGVVPGSLAPPDMTPQPPGGDPLPRTVPIFDAQAQAARRDDEVENSGKKWTDKFKEEEEGDELPPLEDDEGADRSCKEVVYTTEQITLQSAWGNYYGRWPSVQFETCQTDKAGLQGYGVLRWEGVNATKFNMSANFLPSGEPILDPKDPLFTRAVYQVVTAYNETTFESMGDSPSFKLPEPRSREYMFEVIQAKVTTSSKISTVQPQQWLLQQEVERDGEIFYHAQMESSAKIENVVWLQGKEIRSIDFRPKADAPQGFKPLKIRWKKERIVDFHLAFSNPPQILPHPKTTVEGHCYIDENRDIQLRYVTISRVDDRNEVIIYGIDGTLLKRVRFDDYDICRTWFLRPSKTTVGTILSYIVPVLLLGLTTKVDDARVRARLQKAVRSINEEEVLECLNMGGNVDVDFFILQVKVTFFVPSTQEKEDRIAILELLRESLPIKDDEKGKITDAVQFIETEAERFPETFGKYKGRLTKLLRPLGGEEVETAAAATVETEEESGE